MTGKLESWLAHLSDPVGANAGWSPEPFAKDEFELVRELLRLAGRHNVRPALASNLAKLLQTAPDKVLFGPAATTRDVAADLLVRSSEALLQDVARAMLLKRTADEVIAATSRSAIPLALVKGIDFAENAYGGLQKRTFFDIDLLVSSREQARLAAVLASDGFTGLRPRKMRFERTERQWIRRDGLGNVILVEVHTDMIHDVRLRKRLAMTYDLYADDRLGGITPASRLVLAAIHGAASHLFGRLQYVVDAVMIARMGVDPLELKERARLCGALLPVTTVLRLGAAIYGSVECRELLASLPRTRWATLESKLIPPDMVLAAKSAHRWVLLPQRYMYRRLLRSAP